MNKAFHEERTRWCEAKACTCAPFDAPYREYQKATAVFIGKVISSKNTGYERAFQFSVTASLKGVKRRGQAFRKGMPIKIKVQQINEPLKIVVPFPKRIER